MSQKMAEMRFPAQPDRLCLVRSLVRSAAESSGCRHELSEQLVLAINEACMNVIQHAYKGDGQGEIVLEIFNNGEQLRFRLQDFADPVDLDSVQPRDLDQLRPGGLGTHFIRTIMDQWNMGHLEDEKGNYLEMVKRIV